MKLVKRESKMPATPSRRASPKATSDRQLLSEATPAGLTSRVRAPARNEYILQVTSGGASLLPDISRPPALVELEQLLLRSSTQFEQYEQHSWIRTTTRISARGSSFDSLGQRSKSAQVLRAQEKEVRRSQRLYPLKKTKQPRKAKPQHHDDLELLRPTLPMRAPLQPGKRMGSLKQMVTVTREQILAKANELEQQAALAGQATRVNPAESDTTGLRGKLRAWVAGDSRSVEGKLLGEARAQIWKSELERSNERSKSAVAIQRLWRTHRQKARFRKYLCGRTARAQVTSQEIFSLWVRVHCQRPMGRGGRSLLSFWTIAWRVEVRNRQIAREKAKDLKDLWWAVYSKRVLKAWLKGSRALRMQHAWRTGKGLQYWQDYCSDERLWKMARQTVRRRFIHHAFRVLLFHGRCSTKCRQRSYRLFRLEEQSVHPLIMPVDRFRGYGNLFNCEELLDRFRDKDAVERKVQRLCYVRLAPRVIENWCAAVDHRKMRRYATRRREETLLSKSLQGLRELTALDENGERLHTYDSEPEEVVKPVASVDMVKQLETDIDHLSGLVDHEHRENLRLKVKEEKRKMMVRIKFDALSKEREVLETMPAEYEKSSNRLEEEIVKRESLHMQKRREEAQVLESVSMYEEERWGLALDRVRNLWDRAVSILADVYDDGKQQRSEEVFASCWTLIRRPAFKVRMRRIMNRGHLRRLLVICAHHRKMERSIHKFRPLRLLYSSLVKWLVFMENSFKITTPGLKARVRRRYELRQGLSEQLELEHEERPIGSPEMALSEMLSNLNLVFAAWTETVCNITAYRAIAKLMAARSRARLLARAFEFLWLGKSRRTGDVEQEVEEGESCYMAANASADLTVWRKCFFTGTRYTTVLRKAAEMRKRMAMKLVKSSVRLAPLLWERREDVLARLEHEKRLLIRQFDNSESQKSGQAEGSRFTLTGSYPTKHWSTVLNLRRNEVLVLLDASDAFAQRIHRPLGVTVSYALSLWLFRVRYNHLPELKDRTLSSDKSYWRHIKELFQHARTGSLMQT